MRLTKLVTVGLATAALAASGATAEPGHGKAKGQSSRCRPAPLLLAGTLANDPAASDTSFQLTVKHANVCRADVGSAVKAISALPAVTARLVLDKGQQAGA